jgi:hypothetical protein
MRAFWITVIIIMMALLVCWVRAGAPEFGHIARVLPRCHGSPPSFRYAALGGLGLILVFLWGMSRLYRGDGDE